MDSTHIFFNEFDGSRGWNASNPQFANRNFLLFPFQEAPPNRHPTAQPAPNRPTGTQSHSPNRHCKPPNRHLPFGRFTYPLPWPNPTMELAPTLIQSAKANVDESIKRLELIMEQRPLPTDKADTRVWAELQSAELAELQRANALYAALQQADQLTDPRAAWGSPSGKSRKLTPMPKLVDSCLIRVSDSTTQMQVTDVLDKLEEVFFAEGFPEWETNQSGVKLPRWTMALPIITKNADKVTQAQIVQLGKDGTPWSRAREEFISIVVRTNDVLHAGAALLALTKDPKVSVRQFALDFARHWDATVTVSSSDSNPQHWSNAQAFARFLFLAKLPTVLRELVMVDARRAKVKSFGALAELCATVDKEQSSNKMFKPSPFTPSAFNATGTPGKRKRDRDRDRGGNETPSKRHAGDRDKPPAAADNNKPKPDCPRCNRPHHGQGECTAQFRADGRRLNGRPPAHVGAFVPSVATCKNCHSSDHLSHYAGCPKQPSEGRGAKPERSRPRDRESRPELEPGIRAISVMKRERPHHGHYSDDEDAELARTHEEDYGCTICGSTDHVTGGCPFNNQPASGPSRHQ